MKKYIYKISGLARRADARINRYINLDLLMRRIIAVEKYIDTVIKYPKTVLAVTLAITIILFFGLLKIGFDNSMDVLMPGQDEEYLYYKKVQETYGNIGKIILIDVSGKDGIWNHNTFQKMDEIITDLEEYKDHDIGLGAKRLQRLAGAPANGARYGDFINDFSDDPGLQRLIKRKLVKLYKEKNLDDLKITDRVLSRLRAECGRAADIMKKNRINYIYSPLTIQDVKDENDMMVTYDLVKKDENGRRILPDTKEEFDRLKGILLANPFFERYIYAKDKKTGEITDFGIIILTDTKGDQDEVAREIFDITEASDSLRLLPTGISIINIYVNDYIQKDLLTFIGPIFILMIMIYYLNFRTPRALLLSIIVLAATDIWTLGLMGYLGYKITIMGTCMPVLLMAVGSSYSIQLLNQYYLDFDKIKKMDRKKGLKHTVTRCTATIIIASFTTVFGFLSIMTNEVTAMKQWAIFTAAGICISVILTFTIIPAFFAILPHKMPGSLMTKDNQLKITPIDRLMPRIANVAIKHSGLFLTIVGIIIIISFLGLLQLRVDTAPLRYFKKDSIILKNLDEIGEKFGGSSGYNLIIDSGSDRGITDPEFLNKVDKFRAWLTSDDNRRLNIGVTNSFNDFIKKMHMSMNGGDMKYYKIPDKREDIEDYLELYGGKDLNSDGRPDEFEPYIDKNYRCVQILARLCDRENTGPRGTALLEQITSEIRQYLDSEFAGYRTKVSGEPVVITKLSNYVTSGQVTSFLQSLVVICFAIMLLFKSYKAGLLAIAPLITTVCMNFGIMGWLDIPLDIATAMIASIAIGTGDDVNIHFIHTYRHHRETGLDIDEALIKTLSTGGKAILYSGITLFLGFSVVGLSNFRPAMLFGLLCGFSLVVTTMGALFILPSIVKLTGVNLEKIKSDSLFWKYLYLGRLFEVDEKQ